LKSGIEFEWNKAVNSPEFIFIDVRPIPLLVLSIFIGPLFWVWLGATLVLLYAKITRTPLAMIVRKFKLKIIGKKMIGYPFHRQHGMKYTIALVSAFGTLNLINPTPVQAEFRIIDSLSYGVEWRAGDPGTQPQDVVEGFANDVPMELALRQVVPEDWVMLFTQDVDKNQKVTWFGGKPWANILKNISESNSVNFEIQSDSRKILVENAGGSKAGKVVFKTGVSSSTNYQMKAKVWQINKDQYLSEALSGWARSVGWNLHWDLERDFIIEHPARFNGTLMQAIEELISSYQLQRAMLRVKATQHFDNRIIHIHKVSVN